MARSDVPSKWQETLQFAVISSARRLRLSGLKDGGNADRWKPFDYIEVDNRTNPTSVIFWALNGRTASSSLATAAPYAEFNGPIFRLSYKEIDRVFALCTSISVVATVSTTIYVTVARY